MMTKRQREYTFRLSQPYSAGATFGGIGVPEPIIELAGGNGFVEGVGLAGIVDRGTRQLGRVAVSGTWVLVGLLLCSGLVFLCWLYRAACNVRALGAQGMQVSPAWAVSLAVWPLQWRNR
ncbi:DUF4328 domain-containing protein [Eikenella exigua]|uniref:DUF4328 domain-containing protein n=1 Tax=Eikenella exigua TaxID=2528037 RepID=A0AAX1F9C4_9NEIS|nr:DUF4328 domain-containing protein [Eikenella exigua]